MPRSFMVRKIPGTQAVRSRTTPYSAPGGAGQSSQCSAGQKSTPESPALVDSTGKADLTPSRRQLEHAYTAVKTATKRVTPEVVSRVSDTETPAVSTRDTDEVIREVVQTVNDTVIQEVGSHVNDTRTPEVVKTITDTVIPEAVPRQAHVQAQQTPQFLGYDPLHQIPFGPSLVPVPWNPYVQTQLPPLMHFHASIIQQLPVMFPPFSSAIHIEGRPYSGGIPGPLRVISPTEIPSPPSMTEEEHSSYDSTCTSPVYLPVQKLNNQSHPLLQPRIPCQRIGVDVTSNVKKSPNTTLEMINNGFGIKNPIFSDDTNSQPLHSGISPTEATSGHVMTSDTCNTCRLCGLEVDSTRLLQKHMKTHKEVKRFLCTVCGKGFNDTFDLKRHTRTHTGVRPYKCEQCSKAFTQRCSLESHVKKIHGIRLQFAFNERRMKMYVCEECGHSTSDPEEHILHLRTRHPNNPSLLRCHDRRQFKFRRRKYDCLDQDFQEQRVC